MRSEQGQLRPALLAMLLAALAILWLGNYTDIDLRLADAMYDPRIGDFPWRHAWLAERFNHELLRRVLVALGVAMVALAAWDTLRPGRLAPVRRRQLRVVALSALLVPASIALLKSVSSSHCPWDLARYGGVEPYVRLLELLPAGVAPGGCMPAGHASSALWMISFAVFLLPGRRRAALGTAAGLLAFGLATGWLQQMRGAHFLTHTLWSAWISCAVILALLQRFDFLGAAVDPRSIGSYPERPVCLETSP